MLKASQPKAEVVECATEAVAAAGVERGWNWIFAGLGCFVLFCSRLDLVERLVILHRVVEELLRAAELELGLIFRARYVCVGVSHRRNESLKCMGTDNIAPPIEAGLMRRSSAC